MASKDQSALPETHIIPITDARTASGRINELEVEEEEEEDGVPESLPAVTSHVYITQPVGSSGPLDRKVVLRRIRQRKHANRISSALSSFFSGGKADGDKAVRSDLSKRWIDDAFAAP